MEAFAESLRESLAEKTAEMYLTAAKRFEAAHPETKDPGALVAFIEELRAEGKPDSTLQVYRDGVRKLWAFRQASGEDLPDLVLPVLQPKKRAKAEPAEVAAAEPAPAITFAAPPPVTTSPRRGRQPPPRPPANPLANLLPSGATLEVSRRLPSGETIYVDSFTERDLSGYTKIEPFLREFVAPRHEPPFRYVVQQVLADGRKGPAISVPLEDLKGSDDMTMNGAVAEQLRDVKTQLSEANDVEKQVDKISRLKEALSPGDAPPDPFTQIMLMREMARMDREEAEARQEARAQRERERAAAMASSMPPPADAGEIVRAVVRELAPLLKPEGGGFKDTMMLVQEMNRPVFEMMKDLKDEIRTQRRETSGGLTGLVEGMKQIRALQAEDPSTHAAFLASFGQVIKELRSGARQPAGAQQQQGQAQQPAQGGRFVPPDGFKAATDAIASAPDAAARTEAMWKAVFLCVEKGPEVQRAAFKQYLDKVRQKARAARDDKASEDDRKARRAEFRAMLVEFVDGMVEEGQATAEVGRLCVEAIDASLDEVMKGMAFGG